MKKIILLFAVLSLVAFNKKIITKPSYQLILKSNIIVAGKVTANDTTQFEIEIEKEISKNSLGTNLKKGQKLIIAEPRLAYSQYKPFSSVKKDTSYIFYLFFDEVEKKYFVFDQYVGKITLNENKKFAIYNGKPEFVYFGIDDFDKMIRQFKEVYFIDPKTNHVTSKLSKDSIFKKYKLNDLSKKYFNEVEYFRSQTERK